MEEILYTLEDFYYDHKRSIVAAIIIIIGLLVGYIVFLVLYNPLKIRFEGGDQGIVATESTKLQYKAIAYDKKKSDFPVTWEVSGGTLNTNEGQDVEWQLPKEAGTYTITARSAQVSNTRKVTVMENVLLDTLPQVEVTSIDTDMDGLTDEYEMNYSNTDSKKNDCDGDTIFDGDEVLLGLDPNLADSKADGIKDSERELKYRFTDKVTNAVIEVTGYGNLTKTTIDTYKTVSLKEMKATVGDVNYIYSNAKIKNINVILKYDKSEVQRKGLNEDALSVYLLDEKENQFIKLDSALNKDESAISTNIQENGKLVIADSEKMPNNIKTEVMFVIDNSGSMYSKEQIAESSENDVDFKRLTTAKKMVDKLKGDYKFGAGKFTFEYENLSELTDDKETLKTRIDSIKNITEKFTGTNIGAAIEGGLTQFPEQNTSDSRRYMIVLTDGKDTTNVKGYDRNKVKEGIEEANRKGVKIYTIGLGQEIDPKNLSEIAEKTNGKYYYALNADILDSLFEIIAAEINHGLVDDDGDHVDDSILIADSKFLVKRNGFSFTNMPLKNSLEGYTYGMSLLAKLYYEGTLPRSLSKMTINVANSDKTVVADGFTSSSLGFKGTLYENKLSKLEFLSGVTKDYWTGGVVESVLKIKGDYRKTLEKVGITIANQPYSKSKSGFTSYEIGIVDTASKAYGSMPGSVKAFFNATNRLDILKYRDDIISFKDNSEKAMIKLKETLDKEEVCLLKLNDNYAVNAIKLIENNSNPNKFRIEVYDCNVSGEKRYIDCTRSVVSTFNTEEGISKEMIKNYIYSFTYNGKNVEIDISIPNIDANV